MSINSYLEDYASNLVLSTDEKNSINTSISTLESRLESYFSYEIEEKFKFGSYTRGTILPRKVDENSDVDYMIVFDNYNNYKPQTFLDKLKRFAETKYSTSEIHQSYPTIVLELNHIKFELVPAYKQYGVYYIPNGDNWISTYPNEFNDDLVDSNIKNNYKIKPIVRLMKYWNVNSNHRDLTSYEIEKRIASEMKYSFIFFKSYLEYTKNAFNTLKTMSSNYFVRTRIDNALNIIDSAVKYEEDGMPNTALKEIKKIFPEV